jgi:uncharacterized protein
MLIVIAGGTGFLGAPLADACAAEGHDVLVLTRRPPAGPARHVSFAPWAPADPNGDWQHALDRADAVVNLAGTSIAGRRWTAAHKAAIRESRLTATRSLVDAILRRTPAPALVSASAIGYYGDRGSEILTESSPAGSDFLAGVCVQWEAEAMRAAAATRVAIVRTGIVLDRSGGALEKMLLPFRLFAGGPLGSGGQYMSWIHRDDWVHLVRRLATGAGKGPFNATAPNPVTNREFASELGRALGRPSFMPAPAFALKIAVGEMAGPLLLASQRVIPSRAPEIGFTFTYQTLPEALAAIL